MSGKARPADYKTYLHGVSARGGNRVTLQTEHKDWAYATVAGHLATAVWVLSPPGHPHPTHFYPHSHISSQSL